MTAIVIILILLGILLLSPLGIRVKYGAEGIFLSVRFGFIKIKILPKKESKKKKKPKKKKPKKKKEEEEKPESGHKKGSKKPARRRGLSFWLELAKNALRASGIFFRGIVIDRFIASVTVADPDAAKAAITYGRICAAAGYLRALTYKFRRVKQFSIDTGLDFFEDKMKFEIDAELSFLLYSLFGMGFCFAFAFLKMILKEKTAGFKLWRKV